MSRTQHTLLPLALLCLAAGPARAEGPLSREALFGLPPAGTAAPAPAPAPASAPAPAPAPAPVAGAPALTPPGGDESPVTAEPGGLAGPGGSGGPKVSGFLHSQLAYTYGGTGHWSLFQNMAQVSASGRTDGGIGWKVGARAQVDPVYAGNDYFPGEVRDNQKHDAWVWESYLDFATGPVEWRVGRQHIVWGEVVAFYFADVVSSFDQRQFILPDFELSRLPQWAARAEWFQGDFHAEAVWVPVMTYDEIGKPGADFYPFQPGETPGFTTTIRDERFPDEDLGNSGYGLRANYLTGGWDASLFFWSSPDRFPVFKRSVSLAPTPTIAYRPIHERIHQYGGTVAKDLGPFVVKGEAIYTRGQLYETADPGESDGLLRSDALDWIASVEFAFENETRLNLQYIQARVFDREPGMVQDALTSVATVLLSTKAFHPKVAPEILYATALGDTDWNLQGRVTWAFQPNWSLVGGVDVFGGGSDGYFGRFEHQDRVYGEVWYRF